MRGSFSLKLRARSRQFYLKRDSGTGVVNFATFLRATFLGTRPGDCFLTYVTAIWL